MVMNQAGGVAAPNRVVNAGDLGPLAWVLDETRKSIEAASKSLKRFAHDAEAALGVDLVSMDASQLRLARQQLHQVVGVLDMVGQDVAAQMVRGMETAVQQFVQRPEKCTSKVADSLEKAGFALVEFLESQLGDKPRPALGLFPQFRQVQEMAGADRVHPADLWPVAWRWADPATPAPAQSIPYAPEVRSGFDHRVLKIMKHGDVNAAAEMGVMALGLSAGESEKQPVIFWKLTAGFFEALGHGLIPMDVYAKRVASRVLLQYASLARGDKNISERLALDMLFFCAQARLRPGTQTPTLDAVRKAWGLHRYQPVDYETPIFGLYDPGVLAQARRRVDAVKENWSALAGGDMARLKACVDQFGLVVDSLVKLHPQGKPLADALSRVAEQIAQTNRPPSAELAMETATAVLFLEASFAEFEPSDAVFTQRLSQLAERLDAVRSGAPAPALEVWMEELYRSVSDRQTMGTVVGELRTTLGEAEQHLDQFFRNPADKQQLANVPGLMAQMKGVLSVLGLDQAAHAVQRMRDAVDHWLADERELTPAQSHEEFERLGSSLGALGFLVDMLAYQPVLARKLFVYDAATGELKHVSGRINAGHGDGHDEEVHASLADDKPAAGRGHEETAAAIAFAASEILMDADQPPDTLPGQLEQLATQAALDDKPALAQAANRAAEAARKEDASTLAQALETLQAVAGVTPAATLEQAAPVAAPAQETATEDDGDDELLEIFLEEAREVVQTGASALQALAMAPADMEQQTTLRRAFHTLKGSSRMVGLSEFGEAAWSMEQLLNAWLAEQKPVSEDLRGLAGEAMQAFGQWVEDIAGKKAAHWRAEPFTQAADALRTQGARVPLVLPAPQDGGVQAAHSMPVPPVAEAAAPLAQAPAATPPAEAEPAPVAPVPAEPAEGQPEQAAAPAPTAQETAPSGHGAPSATLDMSAFGLPDLVLDEDADAESVEIAADFHESLLADESEQAEVGYVSQSAHTPEPAVDVLDVAEMPPLDVTDGLPPITSGPDSAQGENLAPDVDAQDLAGPLSIEAVELTDADANDADALPALSQAGATPLDLPGLALPEMPSLDLPQDDTGTAADTGAGPADEGLLALELDEPDFAAAAVPQASPYATAYQIEADEAYTQIGDLRISTPLYNVYLIEADEWSRQLNKELADWSRQLARPVPDDAIARAHSLAGSSATVGFIALSEMARAVEHALQRLHGQPHNTAEQVKLLSTAAEDIRRVLHQFAVGALKTPDPALLAQVQALEPTASEPEAPPATPASTAPAMTAPASAAAPTALAAAVPAPAAARPHPASVAAAAVQPEQKYSIADEIDVVDVIDPDLFPIFEEEAEELFPNLSAAMREWLAQPQGSGPRGQVLRVLHTLKGSARLAGALRLGEMAHRTESAIETIGTEDISAADLEPVQEYIDELQSAFRRLQTGEAEPGASLSPTASPLAQTAAVAQLSSPAAAQPAPVAPAAPATRTSAPAGQAAPMPQVVRGEVAQPVSLSLVSARAAASQAVRVRSQLLDRLVAQAGEVVTSRARLETEMLQLRTALNEMTGNLERLRKHLRDVELQAETQMQSRLALTKDAQQNFDPLEFDRFTRMQELTRMMAESVNDIATVQRSLQRAVEASENDLAVQARQSRELQRDLLRTRMVEFEGISERLYRVVRQASKETGKQVRLDIAGGSIEMDRGILDRMTPAFEHLLRNCVVHGIEDQATRTARSKDPTGLITIEVQQAGNDVSVEFRDDGAGLNLARIRERAQEQGLITAGQSLTDAETGNLIFAPGFSTATEVSELAGRGVGMDVVRTEVQALGGRIETATREGLGASFRLVLPLTTAVTHVVMIRAGKLTVGVPSNLVEIVHRASAKELQEAYASGNYRMGDATLPFFWAGALLQDSARSTEPASRANPVVIFRSAAQRVALHVDEVLGNQEVVVKALGPQLSRLPGLAAITALASGAVALIYNPVALAAVYGPQARDMAAEAPAAATAGASAGKPAAAPHSDIPLVLVVDDSITVRRVTQRLLQREGYRVALAADGLQGLERLQEERPTVVLSDIEMPRMDGFDFVRNIRADEKLADLPVIMITSRIAEKHREHARELGVSHYLGKPYSEEQLLGLIKEYAHAAAQEKA